jgi:type II secretory pathway pseudopilin PulG
MENGLTNDQYFDMILIDTFLTKRRKMGIYKMKKNRRNHSAGLTLVEVMVVVLIIAVAFIGAMGFRLYSVADAKRADVQVNAARIGSMLLENWKAMGGYTDSLHMAAYTAAISSYSSQIVVRSSSASACPAAPADNPNWQPVMWYEIQDMSEDNSKIGFYYVTLSFKPAASSPSEPPALNATIGWRDKYGQNGTLAHTISITTYQD